MAAWWGGGAPGPAPVAVCGRSEAVRKGLQVLRSFRVLRHDRRGRPRARSSVMTHKPPGRLHRGAGGMPI